MDVLTGVVEGNQQVGAGLPRGGLRASLDDGEGPQSRRVDLLKHAASGVDDKHQRGRLLHTKQPCQSGHRTERLHALDSTDLLLGRRTVWIVQRPKRRLDDILRAWFETSLSCLFVFLCYLLHLEGVMCPLSLLLCDQERSHLRKGAWPTVSRRSFSTARVASEASRAASRCR